MTDSRGVRRRWRRRRAFTILEMVVVVVILALLAGMVMPRLVGASRRQAILAAEETAEMLSLFAHRESMGSSNIAIGYDPDAGTIMLLELLGDPADPDFPPRWTIDPFVSPVRLPEDMSVLAVRQDGMTIGEPDWFIPIVPGQGRPTIEIVLVSPDIEVNAFLPSYSLSARLVYEGDAGLSTRLPVDLDYEGRSREVW